MNIDAWARIADSYLTLRLFDITLSPVETSILALSLAAVILSGFHLWRLGHREDRSMRFVALRDAVPGAQPNLVQTPPWYRRVGGLVAGSSFVGAAERERLVGVLAGAGIKGQGRLASFVASKLFCALGLAGLIWLFLAWQHYFAGIPIVRVAAAAAAFMLGWRLPDIILSRLAARRRRTLEHGMPDAIDLLVICAEAGLSLNQAIDTISRELRPFNRAVADEFAATSAEMRVQPDVTAALDHLAQRSGLDSLRGMITTLKQSMRFGTPLADALRVIAAELRATRLARMEERAARLPVLLAIPLMMFILPSLMMVIGTPVALRIQDTLGNISFGAP